MSHKSSLSVQFIESRTRLNPEGLVVEASLLEAEELTFNKSFDQAHTPEVQFSPALLCSARCACAEYLRHLGVIDPEVLARMSSLMTRRSIEQLNQASGASLPARLIQTTLETTDAYVQKWIVAIEKQIDLHGGISRCGEIAMRMPAVLAKYPEAIESFEVATELFKVDKSLSMAAQPPHSPTKFASQPLTASHGGIVSELMGTIAQSFGVWVPTFSRRHA